MGRLTLNFQRERDRQTDRQTETERQREDERCEGEREGIWRKRRGTAFWLTVRSRLDLWVFSSHPLLAIAYDNCGNEKALGENKNTDRRT